MQEVTRHPAVSALAGATANLIEMFEEQHAPEVEDGHAGDDTAGHKCSYCAAIAAAKSALEAITVGPRELTDAQYAVVVDLRQRGLYGVAEAVERHWKGGEHYYIDERVNVPKRLRKRFDAINDKLLAAEDARFEASQEAETVKVRADV